MSLLSAYKPILPGLLLSILIAMAATLVGDRYGGPVMLYALLFGMTFSFLSEDERFSDGVSFSTKTVLRIGVALLGVNITLAEVASLGWAAAILVVGGVVTTLVLGWALGRLLGLTSDHAVLSAGAVAICGASAALALSAVLPQHEQTERNTILTVVGVTALSTIAMVLYPLFVDMAGFDHHQAGMFIGATIHDVAQVVGAGYTISDETGEIATVVKLMRVGCLSFAVMGVALVFRRDVAAGDGTVKRSILPFFLVAFVAILLLNSVGVLPRYAVDGLSEGSRWALVIAVSALGVKTSLKGLIAVGPRPLIALLLQTGLLAAFVFASLTLFMN